MNVILDPPRTALCVASETAVAEELASTVGECDIGGADTVVDPDEPGAPTDSSEYACLLLHDGIGTAAVREWCRTARETAPDLPVVVVIEEHGTTLATAATVAGASATLFAPDDEQLQSVVDGSIETYVRRRRTAEDSAILAAMLDGLETPLYAKDEEGRHLRLADIRGGQDPEAAIGKTDIELYGDQAPEFARRAYEDDMEVLRNETPVFDRDESHGPEGNQHWSRTTKVPWYDDEGELKGLVGISHDITELKHREMRLDEVRDRFQQFASHLRHDLQNPLQVASGYLEMAKASGDTEPLEQVESALGRMEEMIEDMSRVAGHRGMEEGDATTFSLHDLVEDVWSHLSTGEATLEIELPGDYLVHAEKSELRPLFENLLKNALEHGSRPSGPDGSEDGDTAVGVTVWVGLTDDGGFYVGDDGPGIPESERERVMDPEYTTSEDGTGAGLEIVDNIAGRNGWSVTITDHDAAAFETGRSSRGARVEIRNCLGARDRSPPSTIQSLSLSETADVGELREPGFVEYDGETDAWTVAGDGEDIWQQYNDFKFAYTRVEGPVRIEGQVTHVDNVSEYTKAGVMIRDGLEDDATYGYAGATPVMGTELLWRTEAGADGTSQQLNADPFEVDWYRVDRVGNRLTLSLSTDGQTWDPVDERWIDIADPVYVGLAVSSVVPGVVAEATFRNVTVSRLNG